MANGPGSVDPGLPVSPENTPGSVDDSAADVAADADWHEPVPDTVDDNVDDSDGALLLSRSCCHDGIWFHSPGGINPADPCGSADGADGPNRPPI